MVKRKGFTLVELLVVVALIALLLAMLMPSFRNMMVLTRRDACAYNLRHLSQAWVAYEAERSNELVGGNTNLAKGAWALNGNEADPNTRDSLIKRGLLWTYTGDLALYKCPADKLKHGRSYSIVSLMNANDWGSLPYVRYHRFIHDPGDQIVFVEEHDSRTISNMGSWAQDPKNRNTNRWVDYVANYHEGGDNMGFADGHQEFWFWEDPETLKASALQKFYWPDNGNKDLARLRHYLFNKMSGAY